MPANNTAHTKGMRYASVCSGIEAASVAWEPLGWEAAWFAEIEKFPYAVLAHRFPDVPNLGDMTKIKGDEHGSIDLIVGGTPCQDLSVAGKRLGFSGSRSVLALDFVRLAYECGAKWSVWENVPGVFSSNGGEDFAQLLSLFAGWQVDTPTDGWGSFGIVEQSPGCFGLAWRVLDVQYARVDGFERAIPQRRRRVFLVGYIGDWRCAAKVLFEPEGMLGNSPPRREAREGTAGGAGVGFASGSIGGYTDSGLAGSLRAQGGDLGGGSETLCVARGNGDGDVCPTVTGDHAGRPMDYTPIVCRMTAFGEYETDGTASTMKQRDYKDATDLVVSVADVIHGDKSCNGKGWNDDGSAYTLDTMATQGVCVSAKASTVRRLTPVETERLMGFPDDWTKIPWRGKPAEECPDGPRYKACGNSMGVNVMRWIGTRIQEVDGTESAKKR